MAGHELLSFMDAFSGYNQIIMDLKRPREDPIRDRAGNLLLPSDALRVEERWGHLSKVGEQNVLKVVRGFYGGIHR